MDINEQFHRHMAQRDFEVDSRLFYSAALARLQMAVKQVREAGPGTNAALVNLFAVNDAIEFDKLQKHVELGNWATLGTVGVKAQ